MRQSVRAAVLAAILSWAHAADAAPIVWDISVFNLTGALAGNTYSGTITVDSSYLSLGVLSPSNSDLSIVFNFVDEDGVTPRTYTEADDSDFGLPCGPVPGIHPCDFPQFTPPGYLSFVYVDANSDFVWGFGSFSYAFNGGGSGEVAITPQGVPEPASWLLLGAGLAAVGLTRSRGRASSRSGQQERRRSFRPCLTTHPTPAHPPPGP